jgi:heptosyltransferase-2
MLSNEASARSRRPPRPLIVRIRNWIGDGVLGLPALTALEAEGYDLILVGKRWAADLLAGYGWPVHAKPGKLGETVALYKRLRAECRAIDPAFDSRVNAVTLATSFSSALEFRLAGLKGLGYATEARSVLLKRTLPIVHGGHALVSYYELTQALCSRKAPPPDEIAFKLAPRHREDAAALLAAAGITQPYVLICPFAGGTFEKLDKRWPAFADYTRELAAWCGAQGLRLIIVPGPGEDAVARSDFAAATPILGAGMGAYNGLLDGAALVVSNDTGPGHIAAALGRPTLSVLGPTKPEQWGVWGGAATILRGGADGALWPSAADVMGSTRRMLGRDASPTY